MTGTVTLFPLLWASLVTLIQAELIKLVFESRAFFFFFSFNAAIHSGAVKQNAGDTFISKFLQLRLTQWGFYWAGPVQSWCIKERPSGLRKIQARKLSRFNVI